MTERRKGGRRKGRAVKYSRGEDLRNHFKKANFGAFYDEPAWIVIPYIIDPGLQKQAAEIYKRSTGKKFWGAENQNVFSAILFYEIKKAIKNKRWSYFGKLQKMFELAEKTKGEPIDAIRESLVSANLVLYAQSYALDRPEPKPKDILKAWRLSCPELIEKEDADCYKIMRELGIPRPPNRKDEPWEYIVQMISDQSKNWKIKK